MAFNTLASSGPSNTLVVTTPSDPTQIAAPTGLAATAPVATQVNLSWHDNSSNETAFVVERRLAASSTWQGIATVGVDAQSYIDTGASAATSYVYRVYARNAVAQSPFSNETSVTTPDAEIFISDNIGDATGSTTTVTPGMDIDVSATGSGMGGTSDNVRFVHRLIIGDFDYRVRVDAFSKADPAAAAGLMVRETTGGGARNVFLRTSGEVRLSYRDNPGGNTAELGLANPGLPVWLRLVRSGDVFTGYWSLTGTGWTQLAQATISMDVALRLGIAVASYSASTSTAAFRELGIVQELAPAAPADFSANAQGTHSVLLGWTDAADNETGYRVERRDTGTSAWQTLIVLADGANQYTDASVVPGGEYDYRVLAFNGAGESASGVVSVDIPSDQPNAPANVTGRAAADRAGGVSLSWSSGGGEVAGYRVERRTLENGTAGSWQTVANVGGLATGLRDATATPGKGYQYRVVAIGESADSDPSTVVTVHTPQVALPGVGQPLLDPRVETFSETVARLVWADTAEGELGVRVQRRLAGGQWVDHALLPAESSGFIDRNLAPGANYEYRVRAEGDGVAGSWSGAVNIEMPFQAQWQHVAIGGINSGATSIRPGVHYDVSANGRDIGGTSDELGFVYRHVTGDFDYAVRVTRLAGADPGRMAGLMARASLGSGSANVYAKLLAGAAQLTNRQADDGATSASSALTTVNSARWVRLQRIGGLFVASVGEGGGIWVEIGRVTLGLPAEVMLGLASSAHASDGLVDVRYRDLVNVRGAAVLPPPPANLFAETQSGLVELSWSDTSGGRNGFSVQRREAGGLWQTLGFVGEGAEHYSDASGEAGSSYEYRVAGENSAGIGAYTAPVFALT